MVKKISGYLRAHRRELAIGLVILMSTSLGFCFGYLADRTFNHAPIIIEKCSTP